MRKEPLSSSPLALRYTPEPVQTRWLALFPIYGPALMLGLLFLLASLILRTTRQE